MVELGFDNSRYLAHLTFLWCQSQLVSDSMNGETFIKFEDWNSMDLIEMKIRLAKNKLMLSWIISKLEVKLRYQFHFSNFLFFTRYYSAVENSLVLVKDKYGFVIICVFWLKTRGRVRWFCIFFTHFCGNRRFSVGYPN